MVRAVHHQVFEVRARFRFGWRVWRYFGKDWAEVQARMMDEADHPFIEDGRGGLVGINHEQAQIMGQAVWRSALETGCAKPDEEAC